jgi:hypothetical protein
MTDDAGSMKINNRVWKLRIIFFCLLRILSTEKKGAGGRG